MADTHDDDYDPYLETFTAINEQDKQKKSNANNNESIKPPAISILPQVTVKSNEKQIEKFQYGYQIILNENNDDGLMESFLKDPITEDKTRSDPSDYFNFGLDEEKWRKLLNHSILMHYERHIIKQMSEPPQQEIPPQMLPPANYFPINN